MRNASKAYDWIITTLETRQTPYLICGGLAAIAYGSKRTLNDIDIFIPKTNYCEIVAQGENYITFGPERYQDQYWNVDYTQFTVSGQKIEIGNSDGAEIFDSTKNKWVPINIDFESYSIVSAFGREARFMKKPELINYKRKLAREVDIVDVDQINNPT